MFSLGAHAIVFFKLGAICGSNLDRALQAQKEI
jgi:hypothetical protein